MKSGSFHDFLKTFWYIIAKEKIMKNFISITLLSTLIFSLFSACSLENEKGFIFDEKTFNSEWNKWENRNILNYSFTISGRYYGEIMPRALWSCEYEANIIVKNGFMESFEYIGKNIPYDVYDDNIVEPEIKTISAIYQTIADRATEERNWWKNNSGNGIISTTLIVKYDPQLNYVTFYEPVSNWESGLIVDTTDHAINISNFTVLDN